jgi:hypothetical protein
VVESKGWATRQKIFIAGELLGKLDYDEKIVDAYTKDELRALRMACTEEEWLVWEFFWWSGCREGEVSRAEWCDLDLRKNVLHVQPKPHRNWKVKDKEDRFVPLPPPLMEKLREYKGAGGPGFELLADSITVGAPLLRFLQGRVPRTLTAAVLGGPVLKRNLPPTFVDPHRLDLAEKIEPVTAPAPLFCQPDQSALHGIAMHVAQFLHALLCGRDVEVVEACLPKSAACPFREQLALPRIAPFAFG